MPDRFKVGILNALIESQDIEKEMLEGMADVAVPPTPLLTEDAILAFAATFDALMLASSEPITRRVIEGMPRLKVLARYGIGLDNIDVLAATDRGVLVTNVPDYGLEEVADHAMTLILAVSRKLLRIDRAVKRREPEVIRRVVRPLDSPSYQTLGLVGFGNIARRVAVRARSFGYKIIGYDPWIRRWDFSFLGVERVGELADLLERSDVVSVHASLGPDSRHLIGEEELRRMKPTSYVVNTSRGAVIDEKALVGALSQGRIAGAALDVLETEPIEPGNPLLDMENVILTPHISWYTEQSEERLRRETASAVVDALSGRRPEFLVNPEALRTKR